MKNVSFLSFILFALIPATLWAADDLLIEFTQGENAPMKDVKQIVFTTRTQTHEHWYANFGYYAFSQHISESPSRSEGGRLCLLNVDTKQVEGECQDFVGIFGYVITERCFSPFFYMDVPMKQPPIDANAFLRERFEALIQEFDHVGDAAPGGQVLNNLDAFLFVNGRKFLTEFLQTKTRERINRAEKSVDARECPQCKKKRKTSVKGRKR